MMTHVLTERVLVLNKSWVPINVASVRRALTLVFQNYARIVHPDDYSTYDFESWIEASHMARSGKRIRSANFDVGIPEVIVLTGYNGFYSQAVKFSRRNIFMRDGNNCQYCGKRFDKSDLTLDHVVPRSRGGKCTWHNIVVACLNCNVRKGNRTPDEARIRLLRAPVKPKWATHIGVKVGPRRKDSWEKFLEEAYWDVELQE